MDYDHVWRWGRPHRGAEPYDPQLKGRRCRVRCRGRGDGPLNVAVELDDGTLICAPRYAAGPCVEPAQLGLFDLA